MITKLDRPLLFSMGQVVSTPGAFQAMQDTNTNPFALFVRHQTGDFGDICPADRRANLDAIKNGARILSAYQLDEETRIWIITEADRSATTILLPEEY